MLVLLRPVAAKYFERLNSVDKNRIRHALSNLSKEPPIGDIKPITGQHGDFRLRVGSYRILFRIENRIIFVTNIDPRGQAYKKKNRGKK